MREEAYKALNQEIAEALKRKEKPQEKLSALKALEQRVQAELEAESQQQSKLLVVLYEGIGNLYFTMKQPKEAEQTYFSMLRKATALYQGDREQFDLLLAQANLRAAVFYKELLGIRMVTATPCSLNEQQQKAFDASDKFFRSAVGACMEKIKAGQRTALELQGKAMGNLMVLKGAAGQYKEAAEIGEQLIKLEKALFQATDDAPHALELAMWMNTLASVYSISKNHLRAMEVMEDCIYVLEDKEQENPAVFGVRLASGYLNLGNAYYLVEEEREQAGSAYETALAKFRQLNEQSQGKFLRDEKQALRIAGNYYLKMGQTEKGRRYLERSGESEEA